MQNSVVYALDFDGVLCDSAIETGIAGWKAAARVWPDMRGDLPAQNLIDDFRRVRPIIETGYESILVMRMLYQGLDGDTLVGDFSSRKQTLLEQTGQRIDFFKAIFSKIRDAWIDNALDEWVNMNPLFPGIADKLTALTEHPPWYIVTTKQERFVERILTSNRIQLPAARIFGLDRNLSKAEVLFELQTRHPDFELHFVEDRLATLLDVLNTNGLSKVKLFFADWGYNTAQDKIDAGKHNIQSINLDDFLAH